MAAPKLADLHFLNPDIDLWSFHFKEIDKRKKKDPLVFCSVKLKCETFNMIRFPWRDLRVYTGGSWRIFWLCGNLWRMLYKSVYCFLVLHSSDSLTPRMFLMRQIYEVRLNDLAYNKPNVLQFITEPHWSHAPL